jgi:hypothetical protein
MPCWVLQSMTAVEERVRGNKTNYKQELNKNKLNCEHTDKETINTKKTPISPMVLSWSIDEIRAR